MPTRRDFLKFTGVATAAGTATVGTGMLAHLSGLFRWLRPSPSEAPAQETARAGLRRYTPPRVLDVYRYDVDNRPLAQAEEERRAELPGGDRYPYPITEEVVRLAGEAGRRVDRASLGWRLERS